MKLNKMALLDAKRFYLENHTLKETKRMIYKKYRIEVSCETIRKGFVDIGVSKRSRDDIAKLFLIKRLTGNEVNSIINSYKSTKSVRKTSRELGIHRRVINRILREQNINVLENEDATRLANIKKVKKSFDGNDNEKSYMMGLVEGDLTALKKSKYTIRLSVSSTHRLFFNMLKNVFGNYGPIHLYPTKCKENYKWNMCIDLDYESFGFLLKTNDYLFKDNEMFMNFLAGLIDSDGSIYIRKSDKYIQYLIRVFSQNIGLLRELKDRLMALNLNPTLYLSAKKGKVLKNREASFKYNRDYYILELSRKNDVIKLLNILPIRHPEKLKRREIIFDVNRKGIKFHKDEKRMKESIEWIKNDTKKFIIESEVEYKKKASL